MLQSRLGNELGHQAEVLVSLDHSRPQAASTCWALNPEKPPPVTDTKTGLLGHQVPFSHAGTEGLAS